MSRPFAALDSHDPATEEFFRFADLFPEALLLVAADGLVLAANRGVEQRLGLVPADLRGRRLADRAAEAPGLADYLRACSRSRQMLPGSLALPGPDGRTVDCRAEGQVFRPGADEAPGLVLLRLTPKEAAASQFFLLNQKVDALSREVTQRRQAEEEGRRLSRELERRVAEFESLLNVVPVYIAVAEDPACRRIWSNPAFARLVHATPGTNFSFSAPAEERPTTFRVVRDGREVPADELPMQVATATGREVRDVEFNLVLQDGAEVQLLASAVPLFDEAGKVRGGVFAGVDITERKRNEALLEDQKRVLELMVHGAPLPDVLDALCRAIETQAGGRLIATVLLLDEDGVHLRPVAGRRAPEGWTKAITPLRIGPCVGSCGTAAYRGEQVVVADIAADPLWADFRDRALGHGLRACWSTPLFSSQGKVLGTFAVYYDRPRQPEPQELRLVDLLTRTAGIAVERSRAEKALREREEQFRTLADSIPQLCWMTRPDGHIFWYNRRWYEYTGTTPEQMEGWGWQAVHDPAELPRVLARWKEALATGEPWEDTFPLRRHDGQMRWHLSRAIPVRDEQGRVVRWFGTNTDIEDRREAEARLRRYAERQRLLWEAAAVLLTTDEPDAMLQALFAKIAPHFGLDAYFNFLVTEAGDALRLVSCAGIGDEEARRISRLEFGQAVCGTVARQRRPIAATFIQQSDDPKVQLVKGYGIRCYACNPLLAGSRLLGTLSFASRSRDRFDDEELEFLRTVCHYVTVAYERLRLVHELREADRRKDEFLATLAHELRNPLAPIRNALHLLRLTGSSPALLEQARGMMERQVNQMVRLIDDLLDVSRISRGKLELRRERVDLAAVVRAAVETARPVIEAAGHKLTVSLPPGPVLLDADPTRLGQVLANLLNNAAKYTERGGRIDLAAERQGAEAVVRVRDTGIGIPADQLPRIFEMFVQVDRSLERAQGGLGIGLTLVKQLVELHGGRVEARSAGPGRGSEFILRLPVAPDRPPAGQRADGAGPAAPAVRRRILVADDNQDSAETLGMMLRVLGHEVRTAHDGQAAVETAEAFRPDVVLLDIGMPKLNGCDAARRIRAQEWGKKVLLVALTGWGQDEDRRRTREAGFDEHLVKPADPTALVELLGNRKAT